MAYLGGIEDDERAMFHAMISHFVTALNVERQKTAELTRRLEVADERLKLLEAAAYGLL